MRNNEKEENDSIVPYLGWIYLIFSCDMLAAMGANIFHCARNRSNGLQNISIFIKNKNKNEIKCVLFIECGVCHSIRWAQFDDAHTHKSHIEWTADSTNCHRIQYSIFRHFTALFCRNWSASIDPFSLSFHKQFQPTCTRRPTIFQWQKNEKSDLTYILRHAYTTHTFLAT